MRHQPRRAAGAARTFLQNRCPGLTAGGRNLCRQVTALVYESGLAEAMASDDYVTGRTDAASTSVSSAALVLRLDPASQPQGVSAWLSEERPMRFQVKHLVLPVGRAFDALAYFPGASLAARAEPQ
ncbi:MAG: hypothetical protein ABI972_30285 [Acidobacteriota bacterium]